MRKSYVQESSLKVAVDIDLGELNSLIEIAEGAASAEGAGWRVKNLLESLRQARREAAAEAVREFTRLAE
jgi:hypothetical protein